LDEIGLGSRTLQPHRQLLANGRREPIGKRALDILSVLAEARGQIVTKDELLEQVWPGVIVEENALQVHVVALRKALGPEADRLKTIRGVGYQLDVDDGPQSQSASALGSDTAAPQADPARLSSPGPPARIAPRRPLFALPPMSRGRLGLIAGTLAILIALAGGWWFAGVPLGLRSQERIPVVVRALTVSQSTNATEAALASGITDELIVRLRRVEGLRIATAEPDGSAPGGTFANGYVIDGHIRSVGDRVRVTARLADADGEVLWSETFDRRLADLFDVQEQIASNIAGALSVSFDVGADSSKYGGTDNPEAYAAYMQFAANQTHPDQDIPLRYLERALELDPDYGNALNSLSISYGIRASGATSRAEALRMLDEMDRRSARGLAENPDLWSAHLARGYYHLQRRNLREADRSMARVAQLDEGIDPGLRNTLATYAINLGRLKRMQAHTDSADLIDPRANPGLGAIWNELYFGRYQAALDIYQRHADQAGPQDNRVAYWSLLMLGREQEAVALIEKKNAQFVEDRRIYRERDLAQLTRPQLARWAASHFGDGGHNRLAHIAVLAGIEDKPELALALLRLAFDRPGGYALRLLWHPAFAEARKLPGFADLVADAGLVEAWRASGDWGDFCRPVRQREITCA
jgi:DNA-binding winged helix-turn-helix (wHTH) protein/TolB-like protein